MAEWLLEILSEEIPSRMQRGAKEQLKALAETLLTEESLSFKSLKTYVTPRRLTLVVEGLPLQTPERVQEKKGPRLDAPQAAIDGFLKTAGVKRDDCDVRDTPKGQFLFIVQKEPGRPTQDALSVLSLSLLDKMRWPKSMRWGSLTTTWVRPIQGFLSLFEGQVVPFSYAGITASNTTCGHRFLAPNLFLWRTLKSMRKNCMITLSCLIGRHDVRLFKKKSTNLRKT